jgi:hypothetical protein
MSGSQRRGFIRLREAEMFFWEGQGFRGINTGNMSSTSFGVNVLHCIFPLFSSRMHEIHISICDDFLILPFPFLSQVQ